MSGLDIRTVVDTGVNATDPQLQATLSPTEPGFDPSKNYSEALEQAKQEPADPDELDLLRRKILKSMTTIVPSEIGPLGQEMAQLLTPVFKVWLGWGGWTETVLHCVAEGHIVRKWTSTDNYMTVDIHLTAIALPLKRWWDDNMGPQGTVPIDQVKAAWAQLLKEARARARHMGNGYLRLEMKDRKEGPQQVIRLTGAGVCSHVRVAGPLRGDHGFFECHPDRLLPIPPPKGPTTPGPRGPSAPAPGGAGQGNPRGPTTGGPRGPAAPKPTRPPRAPTTGEPWLPLYDLWL